MSRKKTGVSITSATRKEAEGIDRAAEEIHTKVRVVKFGDYVPEILLDTPISSGWTKQKLGKEVLPPLKQALDEAGAGDQDVDLIVLRHDPVRLTVGQATRVMALKQRWLAKMARRGRLDAGLAISVRPSTAELAEQMLPDTPVPSPAQALLAQRESEARWALLEEFGAWTSEQIADNRSRAKNRHALANRWRAEGKVFSVEHHGQRLFPGFQFDPETYAPEPVVAAVLNALPREQMSDWEVALWWNTANDWLDWRRPVDAIDEDPEALAAAAAQLAEPSPL